MDADDHAGQTPPPEASHGLAPTTSGTQGTSAWR